MGKVFVICEAGISHCGDLRTALDCIDIAKNAGGDAVKFQTFQADKLAISRGKPELATTLKPYEMPYAWLPILKDHCDKVGIEFMTTCYYEEAVAYVDPFVKRFKIGHAESGNQDFVDAHWKYRKPFIISKTDGGTVRRSVDIQFNLLLTIDKYPTPLEGALSLFSVAEGYDGYSDHTKNVYTGMLAVAAGAQIVEVHFEPWPTPRRLKTDHPDRCVSLDPAELGSYIGLIRLAETARYGSPASQGSPVQTAP